jgi:hypothetical protein
MMSDPVVQAAIHSLRQAGYAVVTFTPDEIGDADPWRVEDRLVELGNQVIVDLGGGAQSQCRHDWVVSEETGRCYCCICGEDGDG